MRWLLSRLEAMLPGDRDHERFTLGHVRLEKGGRLDDAYIAFRAIGELNAARDNCVVLPTHYAGTHRSYESFIGPGRAIDPARHFIVIPNLFGNGLSSSPSTYSRSGWPETYPNVTVYDNVCCQRRLLESLGVRSIALVAGWSMGAIQAYYWAATFPDFVRAIVPICGAARCWPLNAVFLDGLRAALEADANLPDRACVPKAGLKAFARIYVGWAYSARFFREEHFRSLACDSVEELYLNWEKDHIGWDAHDLLAMLWTWRHADVGTVPQFGGSFQRALRSIRAYTIVMPCDEDRYFTEEENAIEASSIANAELRLLRSPFGHCAGAPGRFAIETKFIENAITDALARGSVRDA